MSDSEDDDAPRGMGFGYDQGQPYQSAYYAQASPYVPADMYGNPAAWKDQDLLTRLGMHIAPAQARPRVAAE